MKSSILLKIALAICIISQCMQQAHNSSILGKVSGKVVRVGDEYVHAYLGIPYATPPVKNLRFREPRHARAWNSVYNATRKPPACIQELFFESEWLKLDRKDMSEDCLYINVWVPAFKRDREPFATMVWIYGGGFIAGSTNQVIYDGSVMASIGNVIVVSFNYRVGAFGYANFEQEGARGNMGMLDQVMALKWVHRNIQNFGGDKDLITVFGESAGSISVADHLISPMTKGLFKRAILQSGSNYLKIYTADPKVNLELISEFAEELGCTGINILNCMRNVNPFDIAAIEKRYILNKKRIACFVPLKMSSDPNRSYVIALGICIISQCMQQAHNSFILGKVSGKVVRVGDEYVHAYLGIPYATPPVKHLRFREPQHVRAWNSVYNATRKPPACIQELFFESEWLKLDRKDMSEDCLYINVWVPAFKRDREPFATMVWIYGGGFIAGSTNQVIYDGSVMASIGNVIVVSFNYRVGAFGYANFEQEGARGNMGMLDQVMALKWVHRNIQNFGGDKDLITVFGESAGSISVADHLISPMTKGLFKRAILQSGSNYLKIYTADPKVNLELISEFAEELGCTGINILNCMRNVNPFDIAAIEKRYILNKKRIACFVPQKGLPYFPEDPFYNIDIGKFHDVDVLIGETKDEGSTQAAWYKPEMWNEDNPILSKSEVKHFIGKFYDLNGERLDRLFEEYLGNVSETDSSTILQQFIKTLGDGIFSCPILHLAEKLSRYNRKVFHYTFNHTRFQSEEKEWAGVIHFEDVYFVFGMPFARRENFTSEEVRFSRRIIELLTSFAK
ncbi:acetylcholinesterase-1-like, partial [Centruroides sculpturatus]|uniref:acetylcholinesterase-1-like n=1 Tax=Centruroides sculpturatus TaxID=218467 RepID=UPI000C6E5667